ncbi:MAG: insulinase family protein [Syntrophobacterales bacterium]|jgi:predicted Zn-dependent peptidase|nr:insulinase family protein [Syntrophobacterales bacterium]
MGRFFYRPLHGKMVSAGKIFPLTVLFFLILNLIVIVSPPGAAGEQFPSGHEVIAKVTKKEPSAGKKNQAAPKKLTAPDHIVYPPLDYQIPSSHKITLPNGIRLFILEDKELPLVEITVLIGTGSAHDPEGREGLAELVCRSMRTAGVTGMKSDAVDDLLDRYAIRITPAADMEMSRFSLSVLKENLDTGLDVLARMVQTPAFEKGKVRLEKNLLKEGLRRLEDDPPQYAFRELRRHLYKNDSRGRQKTKASLDAIKEADLVSFHRKNFSPANMMMAVTGDISPAEAEKMILSRFFPADAAIRERPAPLPAPPFSGDGATIFVPKETPQSVILMGFPAPSRKEADYFAFAVLDFILGSGGFQSHIFREIRSNHGLAYSAGSFYKARDNYGVLSAYAMTKSASANQTLTMMKSIMTHFAQNPPSPEELRWAKTAMINNFLFSFDSANQIATQEMTAAFDGLPENFLRHYRENIENVTQEDVRAAGEKYLLLPKATIVILGEKEQETP